jgi:hypothetical protein
MGVTNVDLLIEKGEWEVRLQQGTQSGHRKTNGRSPAADAFLQGELASNWVTSVCEMLMCNKMCQGVNCLIDGSGPEGSQTMNIKYRLPAAKAQRVLGV